MQYIRIVVEESEDVEGRTKMTDKVIENNQVTVMGEVVSDFSYSHEIYGMRSVRTDWYCLCLPER